VLPTLFTLHILLFAVFLAAQIVRTHFEERILRTTYPQYEAYVAHTRRLIPFVF
jgi:protein-S-isoprenylcysteine O-methyltransferase Ste14